MKPPLTKSVPERLDPKKLTRPCYRCGAPYGAHDDHEVPERCPEGNWYSKTDTFLDIGPAHDQWCTGDNR